MTTQFKRQHNKKDNILRISKKQRSRGNSDSKKKAYLESSEKPSGQAAKAKPSVGEYFPSTGRGEDYHEWGGLRISFQTEDQE